jgi:hypothetical protein
MRTWSGGAWNTPKEQVLGKELTVTVPKLSPMILQISKTNPKAIKQGQ